MTYDELLEIFQADGWREQAPHRPIDTCDCVFYKRFATPFRCAHNADREGIQLGAQVYDRRGYPGFTCEWGVELILYGATADNENFRLMMYGFDTFAEIQAGCGKLVKAWEALNETAL